MPLGFPIENFSSLEKLKIRSHLKWTDPFFHRIPKTLTQLTIDIHTLHDVALASSLELLPRTLTHLDFNFQNAPPEGTKELLYTGIPPLLTYLRLYMTNSTEFESLVPQLPKTLKILHLPSLALPEQYLDMLPTLEDFSCRFIYINGYHLNYTSDSKEFSAKLILESIMHRVLHCLWETQLMSTFAPPKDIKFETLRVGQQVDLNVLSRDQLDNIATLELIETHRNASPCDFIWESPMKSLTSLSHPPYRDFELPSQCPHPLLTHIRLSEAPIFPSFQKYINITHLEVGIVRKSIEDMKFLPPRLTRLTIGCLPSIMRKEIAETLTKSLLHISLHLSGIDAAALAFMPEKLISLEVQYVDISTLQQLIDTCNSKKSIKENSASAQESEKIFSLGTSAFIDYVFRSLNQYVSYTIEASRKGDKFSKEQRAKYSAMNSSIFVVTSPLTYLMHLKVSGSVAGLITSEAFIHLPKSLTSLHLCVRKWVGKKARESLYRAQLPSKDQKFAQNMEHLPRGLIHFHFLTRTIPIEALRELSSQKTNILPLSQMKTFGISIDTESILEDPINDNNGVSTSAENIQWPEMLRELTLLVSPNFCPQLVESLPEGLISLAYFEGSPHTPLNLSLLPKSLLSLTKVSLQQPAYSVPPLAGIQLPPSLKYYAGDGSIDGVYYPHYNMVD